MRGTGEKKCIPTTFSGRSVAAAIVVIGMADSVELAEHLVLDLHLLEHGLDHQVRVGSSRQVGRRRDMPERTVTVVAGHRLLLDQPAQRGLDRGHAAVECLLCDIAQHHVPAGHRRHLSDSRTHQTCSGDQHSAHGAAA
jgi:hypothetical protein